MSTGVYTTEAELLAALRQGDEAAFMQLVHQHHAALIRLAKMYVADEPTAEEVVQETWIGVLKGLKRFEGRAALRTWIYSILVNVARTRGKRESRSIPFSALADENFEGEDPTVEIERFQAATGDAPGHWVKATRPQTWEDLPEERLAAKETRAQVQAAIDALPPNQREVITLRDVLGWSAEEACASLGISETNQRVLLHRARAKVRATLEKYFADLS